ncbi:MAG: hypothetical protein J6X77_02220 [Bacteroidales bacterium]|nr:hypothetical protein [Bacteroidales bacterium]
MEKSVKEVFNEIQTTIDELRTQLDELEERLAALKAEEISPLAALGRNDTPVIPSEIEESPVEPEPAPEPVEVVPEPVDVDLPNEDIPEPAEEDAPVIPSEGEAEVEESPIDLSIDMAAIGAKTVPDAKNYQWMIDMPGGPVANVISAISLNDRVLFINTLFKEDPALFQNTITELNKMESISEAVSYVIANFPDWNLNSEVVYRLMMAVRRKLK